jgi:hypothetical protein
MLLLKFGWGFLYSYERYIAEVPVPNLLTLNKHDRVWDLLLHQEALVAWQLIHLPKKF